MVRVFPVFGRGYAKFFAEYGVQVVAACEPGKLCNFLDGLLASEQLAANGGKPDVFQNTAEGLSVMELLK